MTEDKHYGNKSLGFHEFLSEVNFTNWPKFHDFWSIKVIAKGKTLGYDFSITTTDFPHDEESPV